MHALQIAFGLAHVIVAIVGTPCYIRIIYVFVSNAKYRSLECYRIMIQIGIVQCLIAPGFFFVGIAHLADIDLWNIASLTMSISVAAARTEAVMSLVLAFNRLKIICDLKYPTVLHTVFMVVAWIVGLAYSAVLFTPFTRLVIIPGHFLSSYDMSLPWTPVLTKFGSHIVLACASVSLLVYMVVILYLFNKKRQMKYIKNHKQESTILIYAIIRFLGDMCLTVCYNFVNLAEKPEAQFAVMIGYEMDHVILAPLLYLTMNKFAKQVKFGLPYITSSRSLRMECFSKSIKINTVVVTSTGRH